MRERLGGRVAGARRQQARGVAQLERVRALAQEEGHARNGTEDVPKVVHGGGGGGDRAIAIAVRPQEISKLTALDRRRISRAQRVEKTPQLPAAGAALTPRVIRERRAVDRDDAFAGDRDGGTGAALRGRGGTDQTGDEVRVLGRGALARGRREVRVPEV